MSEIKDSKANENKTETKPAAKTETKPAAKTETPAKKVPALKVSSLREGFRRGGRAWTKEAQVVKLSDLTKDQIAQIKGEPMLAVVETETDE
jgi:hypothetical protein